MLRVFRVFQFVCLGLVLGVVVGELATNKANPFTIFPVLAGTALALSIGFGLGVSHVLQGFRKDIADSLVECLGGPLDGQKIPKPPAWENRELARFSMGIEEHPEGQYVRDGERLVWEET